MMELEEIISLKEKDNSESKIKRQFKEFCVINVNAFEKTVKIKRESNLQLIRELERDAAIDSANPDFTGDYNSNMEWINMQKVELESEVLRTYGALLTQIADAFYNNKKDTKGDKYDPAVLYAAYTALLSKKTGDSVLDEKIDRYLYSELQKYPEMEARFDSYSELLINRRDPIGNDSNSNNHGGNNPDNNDPNNNPNGTGNSGDNPSNDDPNNNPNGTGNDGNSPDNDDPDNEINQVTRLGKDTTKKVRAIIALLLGFGVGFAFVSSLATMGGALPVIAVASPLIAGALKTILHKAESKNKRQPMLAIAGERLRAEGISELHPNAKPKIRDYLKSQEFVRDLEKVLTGFQVGSITANIVSAVKNLSTAKTSGDSTTAEGNELNNGDLIEPVEDIRPQIGDKMDISSITQGYTDSYGGGLTNLVTDAGKDAVVSNIVQRPDGVWYAFDQSNGLGYAWIKEDQLKGIAKAAETVAKGIGK